MHFLHLLHINTKCWGKGKQLYLDFSLCPNPDALRYARTVDFNKIKTSPATYLWASGVHPSGRAQHAWIYFQIPDSYQWEIHYWYLLWLCSSVMLHLLSWGNKETVYCKLNVRLSRIFSSKCWQARKCQVKGKALRVLQCPCSVAYPDMLTMQNHLLPQTDKDRLHATHHFLKISQPQQ